MQKKKESFIIHIERMSIEKIRTLYFEKNELKKIPFYDFVKVKRTWYGSWHLNPFIIASCVICSMEGGDRHCGCSWRPCCQTTSIKQIMYNSMIEIVFFCNVCCLKEIWEKHEKERRSGKDRAFKFAMCPIGAFL